MSNVIKTRLQENMSNIMAFILRLKSGHFFCVFALVIIYLTSCKPLSKVTNNNIQTEFLTNNDYTKLNGIYANSYDTLIGGIKHLPGDWENDYQRMTVLYQLFWYNYPETAWIDESNQKIDPEEKWIKIEFQSKKQATVSMYHNDKFIFSKRIHGKFKNGYFYLRPKFYVIPFVPLFFGYNFERARLSKTIENKLVINYTLNRSGYALFAGSEDKGFTTTIYKHKE